MITPSYTTFYLSMSVYCGLITPSMHVGGEIRRRDCPRLQSNYILRVLRYHHPAEHGRCLSAKIILDFSVYRSNIIKRSPNASGSPVTARITLWP